MGRLSFGDDAGFEALADRMAALYEKKLAQRNQAEAAKKNVQSGGKAEDNVEVKEAYSRQLILSAMEFEPGDAYWINPGGKIRPVGITHIEDVINHPAAFGLTDKIVRDTYKKYGEKLRIEAKARNEIIRWLLSEGWTRIRYVRSGDYYSIDVGKLTKKVKEYLFEWASKTIELLPEYRYSNTVIMDFSTGNDIRYSVEELVGEALFSKKEQQEPITDYLIPLRSNDDFLDLGPVARFEKRLQIVSGKVTALGKIYGG